MEFSIKGTDFTNPAIPDDALRFLTSVRLANHRRIGYNSAIEYEGELPVQFEWDADKAALNLKKHGVDFRDAVRVFYDVNRIEWYDSAHSDEEDRYNTIGMVREVLFVVYTERRERTRIISARKATPRERRIYDDRHL